MSGAQPFLLVGSILLLLAAHAARALRWGFLFPRSRRRNDRVGLLIGLGIGYAINALVPLRLGELVRGVVAARLRQARLAEVMATIAAERLADLFILALFIGATWRSAADPVFALQTAGLFATAAGACAGGAAIVRRSSRARRAIWQLAGMFNPRIRVGVADFVWSASEIVAGGTLLRWRFTAATVGMWGLYAAAYHLFSEATGITLGAVLEAVLQHPLSSLAFGQGAVAAQEAGLQLQLFVLAPVLLILLINPLTRARPLARTAEPLLRIGTSGRSSHLARSDRFTDAAGYEDFLDALFSDGRRDVSGFGIRATDDCIVHHFYHGGSDALTALVDAQGTFLIRKFAMGEAAAKLEQQATWLRSHANSSLPLVEVLSGRTSAGAYSYDMPLVEGATRFQDSIHSASGAQNRTQLLHLLGRIDCLHNDTRRGDASEAAVNGYVDTKIVANAEAIARFARQAIGAPAFSLNGEVYDFDEWRCLADRSWLAGQIRNRAAASIHGDLTVENVIVAPDRPHGLYVIDPNPENIFDSPLIDWAKMMQSLHLGYEELNRSISCSRVGEILQLPLARTEAYAELHRTLESEIEARFSQDSLREVYFHELVNYLRLTTYKIRQSPERGLAFFACTALLLRRYRERFT